MGVAAEIGQDLFRPADRRLGVDEVPEFVEMTGEACVHRHLLAEPAALRAERQAACNMFEGTLHRQRLKLTRTNHSVRTIRDLALQDQPRRSREPRVDTLSTPC